MAVSAKQKREAAYWREKWRETVPRECMCCGDPPGWLDLQIHEMERGRWRLGDRWYDACNLLLLCEPCHAGMFASMPHARQLAFKKLRDTERYDLERWLRIKDHELRAPSRVTQSEVEAAIKDILAQGAAA